MEISANYQEKNKQASLGIQSERENIKTHETPRDRQTSESSVTRGGDTEIHKLAPINSLAHSRQSTRHEQHGKSRGNCFTMCFGGKRRCNDPRKSALKKKGGGKTGMGKKRGSNRSRDSETGLSGNKDAVMHKQGSLTVDERQEQIEEIETNLPRRSRRWKVDRSSFLSLFKPKKKHKK